jgi:hypothetical protein
VTKAETTQDSDRRFEMSQANQPVTSREFKLMLNGDRFKERAAGAEAFWNLVKFLVHKEGGDILPEEVEEERRRTSYLDTSGARFRQLGFTLRRREESATKFNLNLKYRSPDRYLSSAQDVSSPKADETKFEEDVLPPYSSKYSKSTRVKFKSDPAVKSVGDVTALFPGLKAFAIPEDTPVGVVNDFTAHEVVLKVGKFSFGGGPEVKAALSFWYLLGEEVELPMVGEFSFDYEAPKAGPGELEQFPFATVDGVSRLFAALQGQTGWFNFNLTTKTAFAVEVL